MVLEIFIQFNGSSATYEVEHEIDGIYKAILTSNGFSISHQFPQKILLIKLRGDNWTSDCLNKEIGLLIGQKIGEQEKSPELLAVTGEVNLPDNKQQSAAVDLCKILIIDDDEDDVAVLSDAFTQCGVDGVHYVFSAMQAFIYLQDVEHSCLLSLLSQTTICPA